MNEAAIKGSGDGGKRQSEQLLKRGNSSLGNDLLAINALKFEWNGYEAHTPAPPPYRHTTPVHSARPLEAERVGAIYQST